VNPYDPLQNEARARATQGDETQTCDLAQGFDALYNQWAKERRADVRKARSHGVIARPAETINEWRTYYEMYEQSLKRWGEKASSVYKWALFEEMAMLNSPWIKLWLAFYAGRAVAGALCLNAPKHAVYWHGAALDEYFRVCPVSLLLYEACRGASLENKWWFDFNPSGGHQGVSAFKSKFGTRTLACPLVRATGPVEKAVESLRSLVCGFSNMRSFQ
jgi:lipid II:glycine glycyltransferase (peptidoglycan interpeptide bridge formation enzyme)